MKIFGIKKPLIILAIASVATFARGGNDAFDDWLEGRGFDRESFLRQFESLESARESPADSDGKPLLFRPPTAPEEISAARIALVIPTEAAGFVGRAARQFRDGFIHAAKADGARLRLDTYPTDGSPNLAVSGWRDAAKGEASLIIGPMLKSGVEEFLKKSDGVSVPTILLQPSRQLEFDREPIFTFTLDSGEEAEQIARAAYRLGHRRAMVVVENSPYGRRMESRFAAEWQRRAGNSAIHHRIYLDADLTALFNSLKEESDEDSATAVFLAGREAFARRARTFVPGRFFVFASALVNSAANSAEQAALLNELIFVEMPWFAAADSTVVARYRDGAPVELPPAEQRFFALGVDAFRIAAAISLWLPGGEWRANGVTGELRLEESRRFRHYGIAVKYRDGRLIPIKAKKTNQ